jgi:hypothetical protein
MWMIQGRVQRTRCQKDAIQDHEVNRVNVLVDWLIVAMSSELQKRKWLARKPQQRKEKRCASLIVLQGFGVEIIGFGDVLCSVDLVVCGLLAYKVCKKWNKRVLIWIKERDVNRKVERVM